MALQRPTLSQVADAAGVSVASASRALSGASASPDMVAKVREAADALGYVADAMARSLKVRRTEQLALAVADLGNPVYVSVMRAVEDVVRSAGYRLVLSSTGSDPATEIEIIRGVNRGYADGLIVSPLRMTKELVTELGRTRVPVVVIGTLPAEVDLDNVRVNSGRGVGLAVDHLVENGCTRFAFLNGPVDTTPGRMRAAGWNRAMRAHAGRIEESRVELCADFTHRAGEQAARQLLSGFTPDALVCANDLIAAGALRALSHQGLAVPHDVSVVGMDNTELVELCTPALTSVDLRSAERGRLAARMMLDRLREPNRPTSRTTMSPRLIVRASSREVPGADSLAAHRVRRSGSAS